MDLLVAGLGNPGPEHARDRHNVGWMVVDELARRHGGSFRSKFRGRLGDIRVGEAKLALLKPETYMNESGALDPGCRRASSSFRASSVLVVHDDVDLETGRLQARLGGGLAGHNGLRSIAQRLGSQDFLRLRVGVGRPGPRRPSSGRGLRPLRLRARGRRRGDRRPRLRRRRSVGRRRSRRDAAPLQLSAVRPPHTRHASGTKPAHSGTGPR